MTKVLNIVAQDVRFPTSVQLDGSDAVNVDPDYSAAYVVVELDSGEQGHAFVFTCGRGNEIVTHAIEVYSKLLVGRNADRLVGDLGEASRMLVHDSQLRWLGPEKGVSHMACGALLDALWDIKARRAEKPLWLLLSEMPPEEIVDVVDFSHLRDDLTPDQALEILRNARSGQQQRIAELNSGGYPAYTTTPGWLGYSDEKLVRLSHEAVRDGFTMIKLKVGGSLEDDHRRLSLMRREFPDIAIAIDANQRWEVDEAIRWVRELAAYQPYWVEEPTSTDDILGHAAIRSAVAPVRVATGEAVANRIVFKQLLQAEAIDVLQLDATRVAGVNENIATLLLAARHGIPVCPHGGGVGLCEIVQHLAFFDYAAVSASKQDRFIEYVGHLHEHFAEPIEVSNGVYRAPKRPGTGAEMVASSRQRWGYPTGAGWQESQQNNYSGARARA